MKQSWTVYVHLTWIVTKKFLNSFQLDISGTFQENKRLLYVNVINIMIGTRCKKLHKMDVVSNAKMSEDMRNQQNECAPSKDSDQPGHLPSLTKVFAIRMKKPWVLSYQLSAQRRLWSDLVVAQADLSRCWVHTYFVGFVMSWLKWFLAHLSQRLIGELIV